MSRLTDHSSLAGGGGSGRPAHEAQTRSLTGRGVVARAPGSASEVLHVTFPVMGRRYHVQVPPGNWDSKPVPATDGDDGDVFLAPQLPGAGAVCLVVFDSDGDAWVPIWHS